MLIFLIAIALVFDFINGFHDSSNIVATVISSNALRPRAALIMTAAAEFIAPFLFGVAVANTVGRGLIEPSVVTTSVVIAAILAAVFWNLLTWFFGLPSSSSHALIGGLLGSAILARGFSVVQVGGLIKVVVALFIAPVIGLVVGFLFMNIVLTVFQSASPRINFAFKRFQIVTAISLALSHGSNDAQKTMGIITLGLVTAGYLDTFHVPLWVIIISAGAISLGTALGGWRLIRTLGGRIYKIRPVHAFTSQAASASIILGAALLGGPVSTTHVVGTTIMGVGAAERLTKVRWKVAQDMLAAWAMTIPFTALVGALLYLLFTRLVPA